MTKFFLTGLLCLIPFSSGHAQPYWFYGVGGAAMNFSSDIDTFKPVNAFLRGGLGINEFLEIGVESSFSIRDDDKGPIDYSVETNLAFLKANLNIGKGSRVYFLLGASSIELTGTVSSVATTLDDSGVSYGLGIEIEYDAGAGFFVDYISYYDNDEFDGVAADVTVESLNIGFIGRF